MTEDKKRETCGIIMPIAAMLPDYSESHWGDVLEIIREAIDLAEFSSNLVSDASDVGIIQKRIIQNLYENPIVVCDVSGKNPNVMFELGVRLAFDKPTIIIKDNATAYSFDTAPIEHLEYPRDLRFSKIVEFKSKLAEKIRGTFRAATTDPGYTTFLKHFGEFKVAKLDKKEVSGGELLSEQISEIMLAIRRLESKDSSSPPDIFFRPHSTETRMIYVDTSKTTNSQRDAIRKLVNGTPGFLVKADSASGFYVNPSAASEKTQLELLRKLAEYGASSRLM